VRLSTDVIRSITGRHEVAPGFPQVEPDNGNFVLYAVTASTLLRYVERTATTATLAVAPPGSVFRGVILPPGFYLPSPTVSPSRPASPSRSRSLSRKPKQL
jgi:hypothetical protein